jgi:protein subunit release factor B
MLNLTVYKTMFLSSNLNAMFKKITKRSYHPGSFNLSHFVIHEKDLEEKFNKGSGPGGQSINKSSNKVCKLYDFYKLFVIIELNNKRFILNTSQPAWPSLVKKIGT